VLKSKQYIQHYGYTWGSDDAIETGRCVNSGGGVTHVINEGTVCN
jgi:hypothetical protein